MISLQHLVYALIIAGLRGEFHPVPEQTWMSHLQNTVHTCLSNRQQLRSMTDYMQTYFNCFSHFWNKCKRNYHTNDKCLYDVSLLCGRIDVHDIKDCLNIQWRISVSSHFVLNVTFVEFKLRQAKSGICLYSELLVMEKNDTFSHVHGVYCGKRPQWSVYSYSQSLILNYTTNNNDRYDHYQVLIQVVDSSQQIYKRDQHILYLPHGESKVNLHQMPATSFVKDVQAITVFIRSDAFSRVNIKAYSKNQTNICSVSMTIYDGPNPPAPSIISLDLMFEDKYNVSSTTFQATIEVKIKNMSCNWKHTIRYLATKINPRYNHRIENHDSDITLGSSNCVKTNITMEVFTCSWLISSPPSSHLQVVIANLNIRSESGQHCEYAGLVITEHLDHNFKMAPPLSELQTFVQQVRTEPEMHILMGMLMFHHNANDETQTFLNHSTWHDRTYLIEFLFHINTAMTLTWKILKSSTLPLSMFSSKYMHMGLCHLLL